MDVGAIALGALISGVVLTVALAHRQVNFEELALGKWAAVHYATIDGVPIQCGKLTEAQPCLDGHAARGGRDVVLWLGNSQIHGINQIKPGDQTAPEILHHALDASGLDVLSFSLPNASYQELLVVLAYLSGKLPIRTVIVPFVFDDFRESGLRAGVVETIDDPRVAAILESSEIGRSILADNEQHVSGSLAALDGTIQERSETYLNRWLDLHWGLWGLRPKARGSLIMAMNELRNRVFGITPQSKRPVIPGAMRRNLDASIELLRFARREGIQSIAYIAPLRSDIETPYVRSDYEAFKDAARGIAEDTHAVFANLEAVVPGDDWGMKASTNLDGDVGELDFMHFQGPGHELLAAAVGELLEKGSGT